MKGNCVLQLSFNNFNCTLSLNWSKSVVETPEYSQVESTTWPLVGTTCPVGTECVNFFPINAPGMGRFQLLNLGVLSYGYS